MHLEAVAHMWNEIAFFQAVNRKNIVKNASDISRIIKDLVAKSLKSDGGIDIFAEAILSEISQGSSIQESPT